MTQETQLLSGDVMTQYWQDEAVEAAKRTPHTPKKKKTIKKPAKKPRDKTVRPTGKRYCLKCD